MKGNMKTMINHRTKTMIQGGASIAVILVSLALFTGASIWEGAAAVSSGADLPESGNYIATNSFPRNTIVDVTNLETGKTVRTIVASNLDAPGLLAVLSREGASAIGLQNHAVGRIRMIQPVDPVAIASFSGRDFRSGDPDFDPAAALKAYGGGSSFPEEPPAVSASSVSPINEPLREEPKEEIALKTGDEALISSLPAPVPAAPPAPPPAAPEKNGAPDNAWFIPDAEYTLRPAEERPPESKSWIPDSAYFIDPIDTSARNAAVSAPPAAWMPTASSGLLFGVPYVSRLESGKYYVQLGAYAKAEAVQKEVGKLGTTYPMAVQNAGSAEKPLYRVLVGPVNGGESGALLQRFRGSGYKDAFVRQGG
jgi:hypothetical protein